MFSVKFRSVLLTQSGEVITEWAAVRKKRVSRCVSGPAEGRSALPTPYHLIT